MRCVYLCGCQETGAAMAATPRQEFGEFYQAVFGRLVGQLVLVIGDLHEAEDIAQEALARAAARAGPGWSASSPGGACGLGGRGGADRGAAVPAGAPPPGTGAALPA